MNKRIRWAKDTIRIPANASESDIVRTVLLRLEESDFLPSEEHLSAMLTLTNEEAIHQFSKNGMDPFALHEEQELLSEVDYFADNFFELSPAERKRRWENISTRITEYAIPKTRILALEPGLHVNFDKCKLRDEYERKLVFFISKAFVVIDPSKRFLMQLDFLRSNNWNPKELRKAATRLKQKYPDIIALMPDFYDDIMAVQAALPKLDTTTGDSRGTPIWVVTVMLVILGSFIRYFVPDHINTRDPRKDSVQSENYKAYLEGLNQNKNSANNTYRNLISPDYPSTAPAQSKSKNDNRKRDIKESAKIKASPWQEPLEKEQPTDGSSERFIERQNEAIVLPGLESLPSQQNNDFEPEGSQ